MSARRRETSGRETEEAAGGMAGPGLRGSEHRDSTFQSFVALLDQNPAEVHPSPVPDLKFQLVAHKGVVLSRIAIFVGFWEGRGLALL